MSRFFEVFVIFHLFQILVVVIDSIAVSVFAAQEDIYAGILNELRESADIINTTDVVFVSGSVSDLNLNISGGSEKPNFPFPGP